MSTSTEQAMQPVAVDTAGGDEGIPVVVEGAVQAYREHGLLTTLVGPEEEIWSVLKGLGAENTPLGVVHAPEVIEMHEAPGRAIRRKKDSSISIAYRLLKNNKASAVLSTGNTGAMMAAGRLLCGLMPGIEKPAIATLIPVAGDGTPTVVVDSGANVDCHAHNLIQFAVMGSIYFSCLTGVENPKVGLLSNGTEATKGTDVIRAAAGELIKMNIINYVGFVEGRDIATSAIDVVVCDGFVGNVLIKAMEGCVKLISDQLKIEFQQDQRSRLGATLSRQALYRTFKEKLDYTSYGGAPLLGLTKLAIVSHGCSDAKAVKSAIRVADDFAHKRMLDRMARVLSGLDEALDPEGGLFSDVAGNATAASNSNNEVTEQLPSDELEGEVATKALQEQ